jgi:hypothetical protein
MIDQKVEGFWSHADYDNEVAKESGIGYFNPLLSTGSDQPHHSQVLQNISDVMALVSEILQRSEDGAFSLEECLPGLRHVVHMAWTAAQHEGGRLTDTLPSV